MPSKPPPMSSLKRKMTLDLRADGRLFLYGPFKRDGQHNAPSNAAFDASLQSQNPDWGVRETADLRAVGATNGIRFVELVEMPANNAILVFENGT